MFWPQKSHAVCQHILGVAGKADVPEKLSANDFMQSPEEIAASTVYTDFINVMNYEAADLRAMEVRSEFLFQHRRSKTLIKQARVKKLTGYQFEEADGMWRCKIPDRAVFYKWGKCETKKANRETQKFVMLFLAKYGAPKQTYDAYPFDEFFSINDPDELAQFLNELRHFNPVMT